MKLETGTLLDIDDCPPFGPDDEACFTEIREVLSKHGKLHRFGMTLLHGHFEIGEDEILLETCDPLSRTLTIRPEPVAAHPPGQHRETNWRLDTMGSVQSCMQICKVNNDTNRHVGKDHL